MLIKKPADILPSEITTESDYWSRRRFLNRSFDTGLAGSLLTVSGGLLASRSVAATADFAGLLKSPYSTAEPVTDYDKVIRYNNFYEFGTDKTDPARYSGEFKPLPWTVSVSGECDKPGRLAFDELIRPQQLEERIYRLRCVEAWSMVIPWVGLPMSKLLKRFQPNSRARYVTFTTVYRPREMRGQRRRVLPWPYREGLRIDEAMHPLTIVAVGIFGKVLPNQNGAPLRLVVPWKYGFKSIKSIVQIEFTEQRPDTTWNISAPDEYGFFANVNPMVDHPRWSQAKERRIGDFFKRPTLMFNGYADQVAGLYQGADLRRDF